MSTLKPVKESELLQPGPEFWKRFSFLRSATVLEKKPDPPIRERIFNDELRTLANSIISHAPETSASETLPVTISAGEGTLVATETQTPVQTSLAPIVETSPEPVAPAVRPHSIADALYATVPSTDFWEVSARLLAKRDLVESDFNPALELLLEKTNAGAVCILVPDELEGVYRVSMHKGLDPLTERTFIIGFRDNYLAEELPYQVVTYSEHIKNGFHYRKRFSSEFLNTYPSALYFHFPTLDTSCYCACFHASPENTGAVDKEWTTAFLNSIYPAILKFSHVKLNPETKNEDPTLKFSKLFKRYSHTGKDRFYVTHMTFSDTAALSSDHPFLSRFQDFCTSHQVAERIIILSPAHALLLHTQNQLEGPEYLLQNLALEWGMRVEFKTTEYPGEESNLYNLMLV
ncbi:MAG: hypothetical protein K8S54_05300 [Spirochaetia bacterium]|nr:hypothetical protein [Spirochaetia bacterium]